jgi:asparagine synthase (glutamine-hydrolysing)
VEKSEVKLVFQNNIENKESSLRFQSIFNGTAEYVFFNKLYIGIGKSTHYLSLNRLHFFIHGYVFDIKLLTSCFSQLNEKGLPTAMNLGKINGSYLIVIVDEEYGNFYVITDRINSRKAFLFHKNNDIIIYTNPLFFKHLKKSIDYKGVASFLINGVVYNNLTLFKEIKVLDKSCIYSVINGHIESKKYWEYIFTNEYKGYQKILLKKELAELLMKSLEKRIHVLKPEICFISLSGGYDSRFLLGGLRNLSSSFQLRTFSYGMDQKLSMGDDIISRMLAEKFNLNHHFVQAYGDSFIETIALNAQYGFGLANFCSEIGAWVNLEHLFTASPHSLLFVGDMYYLPSHPIKQIANKNMLLMYSTVFHWKYLDPLFELLPKQTTEQIIDSYKALYEEILNGLPDTNDFQILKDFTYYDQRISHTLTYWREYFHGPFITTTQPLLDNEILDFIRKLPNELRYDKILYKETLHDMFPDLFEVPIARNIWSNPVWRNEITKNKTIIYKQLDSSESQLDSLIPKEIVRKLIDGNKIDQLFQKNKLAGVFRKLAKRNDALNDLFSSFVIRNTNAKKDTLIIRLLILREALLTKK